MPADDLTSLIAGVVEKHDAELVGLRRDLHTHPELSWDEVRTTTLLTRRLEEAGWRISPLPRTGVVAATPQHTKDDQPEGGGLVHD